MTVGVCMVDRVLVFVAAAMFLVEDLVVRETLVLLRESIVVLFLQSYDSCCVLDSPSSVAC